MATSKRRLNTFHPFPRLPFELRHKIWRCAIQPRVLPLDEIWTKNQPHLPIPLLATCYESRCVALEIYTLWGTYIHFPSPSSPRVSFNGDEAEDEKEDRMSWAYVDFERDVFVLDEHFFQPITYRTENDSEMLRRIKHVAFLEWAPLGRARNVRYVPYEPVLKDDDDDKILPSRELARLSGLDTITLLTGRERYVLEDARVLVMCDPQGVDHKILRAGKRLLEDIKRCHGEAWKMPDLRLGKFEQGFEEVGGWMGVDSGKGVEKGEGKEWTAVSRSGGKRGDVCEEVEAVGK
ncbi:hypothetical protein B7494_g8378 [Chlorociboria aeruginascens]|nr:hypothetical protein B7494_g8378 [Chlorociboria aeruginascens]